ncbi:hypothetical protein TNCV_1201301 [Trichonephila clavipes]|nr:hypothetical protein TNCV_1201301 [Trichonephila clavipes]
MSSNSGAEKDLSSIGADACYTCRGFKSARWNGREVWRMRCYRKCRPPRNGQTMAYLRPVTTHLEVPSGPHVLLQIVP